MLDLKGKIIKSVLIELVDRLVNGLNPPRFPDWRNAICRECAWFQYMRNEKIQFSYGKKCNYDPDEPACPKFEPRELEEKQK